MPSYTHRKIIPAVTSSCTNRLSSLTCAAQREKVLEKQLHSLIEQLTAKQVSSYSSVYQLQYLVNFSWFFPPNILEHTFGLLLPRLKLKGSSLIYMPKKRIWKGWTIYREIFTAAPAKRVQHGTGLAEGFWAAMKILAQKLFGDLANLVVLEQKARKGSWFLGPLLFSISWYCTLSSS